MMRKILLTLITFVSFASADYLFQPLNICVKEYWFTPTTGQFFYIRSHDNAQVNGTTKNYGDDFFPSYEYNATSNRCQKVASNNSLGLANDDYTYYMALSGIICGTLIVVGAFMGLRISA